MKQTGRPVRTTILFGLLAAGVYLSIQMLESFFYLWPAERYFLAWLVFAGYGLLLARWAKRNPIRILMPSLALLAVFILARSELLMVVAFLAMLGWTRSRICFPVGLLKGLAAEICLGFGGLLLLVFLGPGTLVSKALGILLFFMVQAVYFVIFDQAERGCREKGLSDPFDKARKEVESILSPEACG
ncbi:MAG: hypothetical protein KKG47_02410 [Proteobacteria bacterium]|nr:hypothetical protein [Pseudomonadota bacterium]MBU1738056.1 hypothetical protein [Pseudomonadota bacterium]